AEIEGVSAEARGLFDRLGSKLGDGFKALTRGNFRDNLSRLTGEAPAEADAHHMLPQAERFAGNFQKAGVNIHDPRLGTWWERTQHLKNSSAWNQSWDQFFRTGPKNALQVLQFAQKLSKVYGIAFPK